MLKLVSNKDGVEIHELTIADNEISITPAFTGITELLSGITDKQQILIALSQFNSEYVWAVTYDSETPFRQPSTEYSLSVVNIIPDAKRGSINQIAALYDCGENNLSVKLIDSNGDVYWGCHSWWKPEHYAIFSDDELRSQVIPAELAPALEHLYERLMLDGNSQENWQSALDELGLSLVESIDIE